MSKVRLPRIFRNFYFITSIVFILWILFFDGNDLITQYLRSQNLEKLQQDKIYFEKEIKKIEKAHKDILNKPEVLEKVAREKHYLTKEGEDVYIIEVKSDKKTEE